ncbi:MAG TPA: HNH endonuclease, partial [Chloroflexia bacterium]|nr:HNH endonuclease [Chloroflexia bacterium]
VSTPAVVQTRGVRVLGITALGHGNRQMCRTDKYGFPRLHRTRRKVHFGFRTGDLVRARVPTGKHQGTHTGRVAVRASGRFRVGRVDGIAYRYLQGLWRADGYAYQYI